MIVDVPTPAGRPRRLVTSVLAALLWLVPVTAQQQAQPQVPSYADGVYYEIFVRSFQDSDGDGVGDFRGLTGRLDYLSDLGVSGVWLMPIHPSPSYHGYDVVDYLAVNPDYGTMEDVEAFIAAAHQRGIRVVLDLVVNHTSVEHPWFEAARAHDPAYRDFYLWSDTPLDWRGTGGGPAWHPAAGGYYLGLFWSGMPELNYRNPKVGRAMETVMGFWLAKGIDGFRIDAIQHIVESDSGEIRNTAETFAWVTAFEQALHALDPDAFLVGETWVATPTIALYHRAGLDMSFDYPLWSALLSAVQNRSPIDLVAVLEQNRALLPEGALRGTFLANHDQIRPATSLSLLRRDPARQKLAAGLLLTLPGTPFLYYGEEIGLPNGPGHADEQKRTPMRWTTGPQAGFTTGTPWQPFSTDDPAVSVEAQADDPDSLLGYYRALIALRSAHPALAGGEFTVLDSHESKLLAFSREAAGERLVVLANFGSGSLDVPLEPFGLRNAEDMLAGRQVAGTVVVLGTSLRILTQR